jgi:hypothetical protein
MYLRLGMSESSLLLLYYIEMYIENYNKNHLIQYRKNYLNWFYSTSGFYDIEINGNLFNFDHQYNKIVNSKSYNTYFKELLFFIKNNTFEEFHFRCHDLGFFCNSIPDFYNFINKSQSDYNIRNILYKEIDKKRIIIIHNLSELMIKQYNTVLKKIYPNFPTVELIIPLKIGYTFMNRPLNNCNNIIERANLIEYTLNECIEKNNINCIIISCGAYSNIFARKLHNKGIRYITIGGELEHEFGIIINRHKNHQENNDDFITVPDELKPENYNEIENGCYW